MKPPLENLSPEPQAMANVNASNGENAVSSKPKHQFESHFSTSGPSPLLGSPVDPLQHWFALASANAKDWYWFGQNTDHNFRWRPMIPFEFYRVLHKPSVMYAWHVIVCRTANNELQRLPVIARPLSFCVEYENTDTALADLFQTLAREKDEFRYRSDPGWLRPDDPAIQS